jgi:hypothetical protein
VIAFSLEYAIALLPPTTHKRSHFLQQGYPSAPIIGLILPMLNAVIFNKKCLEELINI